MAATDKRTRDLPGIPKRKGRPTTGKAKTNAERQAAFRTRQQQARQHIATSAEDIFISYTTPDLNTALRNSLKNNIEFAQLVWVEIGRRHGWLK